MPFVRSYVRSDGTSVRGHTRWAPGARREMTIIAVFGLAVLGFGTPPTQGVTDSPVPTPSVSYPIRFDTPTLHKATPAPSVSYPVDLSALGEGR